jgi:hypothetical protein
MLAYLLLFFGYPVVKNVVMGFQQYTTSTFYTGEARRRLRPAGPGAGVRRRGPAPRRQPVA